jgi:hypothetical protein
LAVVAPESTKRVSFTTSRLRSHFQLAPGLVVASQLIARRQEKPLR